MTATHSPKWHETLDETPGMGYRPAWPRSEATARLNSAEQSMHDWQSAWEEFNQRAAEPTRISEVERARIDQFDRHLGQLDQRRTRLEEERATHRIQPACSTRSPQVEQPEATAAAGLPATQFWCRNPAEQLTARREQYQQHHPSNY